MPRKTALDSPSVWSPWLQGTEVRRGEETRRHGALRGTTRTPLRDHGTAHGIRADGALLLLGPADRIRAPIRAHRHRKTPLCLRNGTRHAVRLLRERHLEHRHAVRRGVRVHDPVEKEVWIAHLDLRLLLPHLQARAELGRGKVEGWRSGLHRSTHGVGPETDRGGGVLRRRNRPR
eukprot:scaffold676_cov316-Pavlova_lutheri.AAC.68